MGKLIDNFKQDSLLSIRADIQKLNAFTNLVNSKDIDNNIFKLVKNMLNYVVPPKLDWMRNKNLTPFAMYFFEFKHTLSQQDLADIWQNLMPEISYNHELQNITIEHGFGDNEMFDKDIFLKYKDKIKFKVFKVKKRATTDYNELTSLDITQNLFKENPYSYNWPYDFFSLVELVNVEAGYGINNNPVTEEDQQKLFVATTQQLQVNQIKKQFADSLKVQRQNNLLAKVGFTNQIINRLKSKLNNG